MGIYRAIDPGYINVLDFGALGDDSTDDTTAIQNALNASDVYFPPGFTFLVTGLSIPSNRRILGSWQSTIKLKDNNDSSIILIEGTNVVIDGIRLDGNKSNQTGTACPGIYIKGASNVTIANVRIENTRIESILISKNESLSPTTIPANIIVNNCLSINPSYSGGFRQHYAITAGRNITLSDNVAESTDGFATTLIDLEPNNAANPIEDVTIVGNVGRSVSGVFLNSAHGQIIKRVTVAGNSCLGFGAGRGAGYVIRGALYVSFSGNVGDSMGTNGIVVDGSSFVSIVGNTIRNYGVDTLSPPGGKDGIQLTTALAVTISGNTLHSSDSAAYGIRETASDCITYVGNNRIDVGAANQVVLLSTNSVQNWRAFDKDGNVYGSKSFLSALGSTDAVELGWISSAAVLRPVVNATLETRTTTLKIGDPSVAFAITGFISGTATWNPGNIADGGVDSITTSPTGLETAALGDVVFVSFSIAVPAGAILSGHVTSTGNVQATLFNKTGSALDLGSGTLRFDVLKH